MAMATQFADKNIQHSYSTLTNQLTIIADKANYPIYIEAVGLVRLRFKTEFHFQVEKAREPMHLRGYSGVKGSDLHGKIVLFLEEKHVSDFLREFEKQIAVIRKREDARDWERWGWRA